VLYGHTARVWDARLLPSGLVSIGEDATVCVWGSDARLISKLTGHRGKSIWSIAVDSTNKTVVSVYI